MKHALTRGMALILVVCTLLTLVGCAQSDEGKYEKAKKMLGKGKYDQALEMFSEIEDYEESRKYIMYIKAIQLGEEGEYQMCIDSLSSLGSFKDSNLFLQYYRARKWESEGEYEYASNTYKNIATFKDSAKRSEALEEPIREKEKRRFTELGIYSDGLVRVDRKNYYGHQYGYIDLDGNLVVPCEYSDTYCFSDGLAYVEKSENESYYIDKSGKIVITLGNSHSNAGGFSEGVAVLYTSAGAMIIDEDGELVANMKGYDCYGEFSEGLLRAYDQTDRSYGYIDKTGKVVISAKYGGAMPFSEGVAAVKTYSYSIMNGNKVYSQYIDKNGNQVIGTFNNEECDSFSEGIARVISNDYTVENKYRYIDKSGKTISKRRYSWGAAFSDGLAAAHREDEMGNQVGVYIDKSGDEVLTFEGYYCESFRDGLAPIQKGDKYACIDKSGKMIVPCEYDQIVVAEGRCLALKNGYLTIFDKDGNVIF